MGVPRGRAGRGGWRPGAWGCGAGLRLAGWPGGRGRGVAHTFQPALDCAQTLLGSVAHIVLIVLKVAERCPHNQTLAARTNSNKYRS